MVTPILDKTSISKAAFVAFLKAQNTYTKDVEDYLTELYRLSGEIGIDGGVIAAQSCVETGNFASSYWLGSFNGGGIGITYAGQPSYKWANGTDAARGMVAHLCAYLGVSPGQIKDYIKYDPRWQAVVDAGFIGSVTFLEDMGNGKWAADPNYANAILERMGLVRAYESTAQVPATPGVTYAKLDPKTLSFPLTQDIVPTWQVNQRPGIKMKPLWINVHETGNTSYGADAAMHNRWLNMGAPGAAEIQVSVHFFVDDHRAYQKLPLDEVSWNAGCGDCQGNYNGISIELCVNADGDYQAALRNVAELVAWLCYGLDLDLQHVVTHNYWSGKWCPTIMLTRGLWDSFFGFVKQNYAKFTTAPAPVPAVTYVKPEQVQVNGKPWDGTRDVTINGIKFHGEVTKCHVIYEGLTCRKWASLDAPETQAPLAKGYGFTALGWVTGETVQGNNKWWVTRAGQRIHSGGTAEQPGKLDPAPQIKENPYDQLVDGVVYHAVTPNGKTLVVTTNKEGVVGHKYATMKSPATNKPLDKGAKFRVKSWVYGEAYNGNNVWLITMGDNRVWAGDVVEKVADPSPGVK